MQLAALLPGVWPVRAGQPSLCWGERRVWHPVQPRHISMCSSQQLCLGLDWRHASSKLQGGAGCSAAGGVVPLLQLQ